MLFVRLHKVVHFRLNPRDANDSTASTEKWALTTQNPVLSHTHSPVRTHQLKPKINAKLNSIYVVIHIRNTRSSFELQFQLVFACILRVRYPRLLCRCRLHIFLHIWIQNGGSNANQSQFEQIVSGWGRRDAARQTHGTILHLILWNSFEIWNVFRWFERLLLSPSAQPDQQQHCHHQTIRCYLYFICYVCIHFVRWQLTRTYNNTFGRQRLTCVPLFLSRSATIEMPFEIVCSNIY